MSKHITITIKVAYDEATVPNTLMYDLNENVHRCIQEEGMLDDAKHQAVVDDWRVDIEADP